MFIIMNNIIVKYVFEGWLSFFSALGRSWSLDLTANKLAIPVPNFLENCQMVEKAKLNCIATCLTMNNSNAILRKCGIFAIQILQKIYLISKKLVKVPVINKTPYIY